VLECRFRLEYPTALNQTDGSRTRHQYSREIKDDEAAALSEIAAMRSGGRNGSEKDST